MTAPQPPSESTEPPSPVIRKLGFASATTKPSNQLMVLRSSRSSTEAVVMSTSRLTDEEEGEKRASEDETVFGLRGQDHSSPPSGRRVRASLHAWAGPLRRSGLIGEDGRHEGPGHHASL